MGKKLAGKSVTLAAFVGISAPLLGGMIFGGAASAAEVAISQNEESLKREVDAHSASVSTDWAAQPTLDSNRETLADLDGTGIKKRVTWTDRSCPTHLCQWQGIDIFDSPDRDPGKPSEQKKHITIDFGSNQPEYWNHGIGAADLTGDGKDELVFFRITHLGNTVIDALKIDLAAGKAVQLGKIVNNHHHWGPNKVPKNVKLLGGRFHGANPTKKQDLFVGLGNHWESWIYRYDEKLDRLVRVAYIDDRLSHDAGAAVWRNPNPKGTDALYFASAPDGWDGRGEVSVYTDLGRYYDLRAPDGNDKHHAPKPGHAKWDGQVSLPDPKVDKDVEAPIDVLDFKDVTGDGHLSLIIAHGGSEKVGTPFRVMKKAGGTVGKDEHAAPLFNEQVYSAQVAYGPGSKNQTRTFASVDIDGSGRKSLAAYKHNADEWILMKLDSEKKLEHHSVMSSKNFLQVYPGSRTMALEVSNGTGVQLETAMLSSADQELGCSANSNLTENSGGFPDESRRITIDSGKTSARYGTAFVKTPGDGKCTTADQYSYLEVREKDNPLNRTVVKLQRTGTQLTVKDQVEAGLSVALERTGNSGSDLGSWSLKVTARTAAPAVKTAPSVTGKQLTSGTDRPVYRFHVTGTAWEYPSDMPQTVSLAPYTVQAAGADGVWKDLGKLLPTSQPKRDGKTFTLGDSAFYFQNDAGVNHTKIRVEYAADRFTTFELKDLQAPKQDLEEISTVKMESQTAPGGYAHLSANGTHQDPSLLQMVDSYGDIINDSDHPELAKIYDLIHFRDEKTGKLITNLYHPNGYTAVTPVRGAHAESPIRAAGGSSPKVYVSTTAKADTRIVPHLVLDGLSRYQNGGQYIRGIEQILGFSGSVRSGFQLACGNNTCTTTDPSKAPALYHKNGSNPSINAVTDYRAVTANKSLPLTATGKLVNKRVIVNTNGAPIIQDSGTVEDHLDITLVSTRGDHIHTTLLSGLA